jgi:hypothetical protein
MDPRLSSIAMDVFQNAMRGKWHSKKDSSGEKWFYTEDLKHALDASVEAVLREVQSISHECKCSQAKH